MEWTYHAGVATGEARAGGLVVTVSDGDAFATVNGCEVKLGRAVREYSGHLRAPHELLEAVARVKAAPSTAARPGAPHDWYAALCDALTEVSEFGAGAGDSLTLGLTGVVRRWDCGTFEMPDVIYEGARYRIGVVTEIVIETVATLGSKVLTAKAAGAATRVMPSGKTLKQLQRAASSAARKAVRREVKASAKEAFEFEVHHAYASYSHMGSGKTLFPVGGLKPEVANGRWNLVVIRAKPGQTVKQAHAAAHAWIRKLEAAAQAMANRYTIPVRLIVDAYDLSS